jgi:glutamate/tyrosine decarboxylase-like PLP-dependent enzyme
MTDSILFPADAHRRLIDEPLTELLIAAYRRVQTGSVIPTLDMATFRKTLAAFDFQSTKSSDEVLDWVIAQLQDGLVHVTHPRYFGLFNPTPTFPAQLADRIVATFNPQLATHTTSPVAVEIEAHVIKAVAKRAGLDATTTGHFTTGGAEANFTALICALTRANLSFAAQGIRCFSGQPVFYVSQDAHKAWFKIAIEAGLGRNAVRLVPTDNMGQMDIDALRAMIEISVAMGEIPVMVVATAGTTNAGVIDPLEQCSKVARDSDYWFHIDAAWGGGLIASETYWNHMVCLGLADSVTIDAHKWFATTMGCGMFFTRHPQVLSSAFSSAVDYMPSHGADDPYMVTVQW